MSFDCQRDFRTSLVIMGGKQNGVEKYPSYGGFEKTKVCTRRSIKLLLLFGPQ
jgi:hypothetical protein